LLLFSVIFGFQFFPSSTVFCFLKADFLNKAWFVWCHVSFTWSASLVVVLL